MESERMLGKVGMNAANADLKAVPVSLSGKLDFLMEASSNLMKINDDLEQLVYRLKEGVLCEPVLQPKQAYEEPRIMSLHEKVDMLFNKTERYTEMIHEKVRILSELL